MKIPTKLKIMLFFWDVLGLLFLVLFIVMGIASLSSAISKTSHPSYIGIFLSTIFIFLLMIIPLFLLKSCHDIYKGRAKGVLPLKVFAVINIVNIPPFGLILSIFTFIILSSPEVKTYLNSSNSTPVQPLAKTI